MQRLIETLVVLSESQLAFTWLYLVRIHAKIFRVVGTIKQLKSAPNKKASSIVYGLHILQVWPSLNIAYEALRQIQRDVCID